MAYTYGVYRNKQIIKVTNKEFVVNDQLFVQVGKMSSGALSYISLLKSDNYIVVMAMVDGYLVYDFVFNNEETLQNELDLWENTNLPQFYKSLSDAKNI